MPYGPSQDAEPGPNVDQGRPSVPAFVCLLPCSNPPVKYLDRLDGCAAGIHATQEDTQDLQQALYGRMGDAISAKDEPSVEGASPDPCTVCKAPIVPSSTAPVLYMEGCVHHFHYGCFVGWPRGGQIPMVACPHCKVSSTRALLWPQQFPTEATKNELFQLQKRCFGIDVAPRTRVDFKAIGEFYQLDINEKKLIVRRPGTRRTKPSLQESSAPPLTEENLAQAIQRLHLADQPRPFYLGDILPLEEYLPFQEEHLHLAPLDDCAKRKKLLFQFWCPFDRLDGPGEDRCTQGHECEFWHGWPDNTSQLIVERVKTREFPRFFCLQYSRNLDKHECNIQHIRMHSQGLIRCLAGFHPTTQDLKNPDGFAHKMAKQIMAPVDEHHLVCAFCHQISEPNSVWIYMQNCAHCMHVHCFSLVRRMYMNPNRKLDLHCPTCRVTSVRTIAWPGSFPSDKVKQAIFTRQLAEFKLTVQADTQLEIVEVAIGHSPLANRLNIFNVFYGGPNAVTIDVAAMRDGSTIEYD